VLFLSKIYDLFRTSDYLPREEFEELLREEYEGKRKAKEGRLF
jgi:hypothetical protein